MTRMLLSFIAILALVACGNQGAGKIKAVNVVTAAYTEVPAIPDDRQAALEKLVAGQKAEIERLRQSAATCAAGSELVDALKRVNVETTVLQNAPADEQKARWLTELDMNCSVCNEALQWSLASDCRTTDDENIEAMTKRLSTDPDISFFIAIRELANNLHPGSWDFIRPVLMHERKRNCVQRVTVKGPVFKAGRYNGAELGGSR